MIVDRYRTSGTQDDDGNNADASHFKPQVRADPVRGPYGAVFVFESAGAWCVVRGAWCVVCTKHCAPCTV